MQFYFREHSKDLKPNYYVIGIIGAQSSGKSTLLNKLFGVNFDVMKNEEERKQTTRGIWCQVVPQHHLMILDIEGTDSRERWEEKQIFERRTALFGLAISNILLVNLWLKDIGRFGASNYDIIRTIFELNMQLFDVESPKKMVFVIRDWRTKENEDKIRNLLITDMKRLWDSIKKTDAQAKIDFANVFHFEFVHLRSFEYEEDKFYEDVAEFKDRLVNPNNSGNMFKDQNFKNIPIDDFYRYMSQTWQTVSENKDLNIPNQKIMISNYRCAEIKEESLVDFRQRITQLQQAENKPDFDISAEIKDLMNRSLDYFDTHTQSYDEKVSRNVKTNLTEILENEALSAFKPQNERWIRTAMDTLEKALKKFSGQSSTEVSRLLKSIVDEKEATRSRYRNFIGKYSIDPVKAQEFLNYFDIELNGLVAKFLSSSTQAFCKKMIRKYVTEIDEKISLTYMNLNKDTWDEFNQFSEDILQRLNEEIETLKRNFSDVKSIFTDEVILEFREDVLSTIKSLLKNKQTFIFEYLIENFRNKFEIAPNGQTHMWRHLQDNEITELYKKAKGEFAGTVKLFEKPMLLNLNNEIVLSIDETMKLRKRFEAETNNILEEVFNKKYNKNSFQKVPKWMWFILAYFMHDNVLEWMRNPIMFFFLVFVGSATGYIYFTNKLDYVMNWWNILRSMAVNKIIEASLKGSQGSQGSGSGPNQPSADRVSNLEERKSDLGGSQGGQAKTD